MPWRFLVITNSNLLKSDNTYQKCDLKKNYPYILQASKDRSWFSQTISEYNYPFGFTAASFKEKWMQKKIKSNLHTYLKQKIDNFLTNNAFFPREATAPSSGRNSNLAICRSHASLTFLTCCMLTWIKTFLKLHLFLFSWYFSCFSVILVKKNGHCSIQTSNERLCKYQHRPPKLYQLKFIYSEKATKFCEISTYLWQCARRQLY